MQTLNFWGQTIDNQLIYTIVRYGFTEIRKITI